MSRESVVTPEGRVSFPYLFKQRPPMMLNGKPMGEPKYSLTLLFPKSTDLTALKRMAYNAVVEKWGQDRAKWPANLRGLDLVNYLSPTGKDGWPFRDGDARDVTGYAGMISITATSKERPGVVDQNVQPILDESKLYAGCYARAQLIAFAFDHNGSRGVSFGLQNVQFVRDGEPFSGRQKPEDAFAPIGGGNPAVYGAPATGDPFAAQAQQPTGDPFA
jgi:hypothetical protein